MNKFDSTGLVKERTTPVRQQNVKSFEYIAAVCVSVQEILKQNHGKLDVLDALHPEKPWRTSERCCIPHIMTSIGLSNEEKISIPHTHFDLVKFMDRERLMKDPSVCHCRKLVTSIKYFLLNAIFYEIINSST